MSPIRPLASLFVLLGAVTLIAAADKPAKKPESKPAEQQMSPLDAAAKASRARTKKALAYGNEDLVRMYGEPKAEPEQAAAPVPAPPGAEGAKPATADPTADPLAWLEQRKAKQAERGTTVQQAQAEVTRLEQKVAGLEKRILAVKNPLLAPPQAPEDDDGSWAKQGNGDRLKRSEDELAAARQELDAARQKLQQAQASGS
ncbi:MAG TPA: hypothetical protein VJS92_16365 [Candidatus Polarisedimenticolaceae bacterium]|nr:hypothetical protein [Candidatus Polarisedimenticolaceae bacterium]